MDWYRDWFVKGPAGHAILNCHKVATKKCKTTDIRHIMSYKTLAKHIKQQRKE